MPVQVTCSISDDAWTVRLVSKEEMLKHEAAEHSTVGLCDSDTQTIYVREDSLDLGTVMHEMFHAHFSYLYFDPDINVDHVEETMALWFENRAQKLIDQAKTVLQLLEAKRDDKN